MEFLKSGWKSVVGSQEGQTQPTVAETIEKLLERLQTSLLLDDRRDACRALKSLAKTYRLEVGAQGLETLIGVLEADRSDSEILGYALDSLNSVIAGPLDDPLDYNGIDSPNEQIEDVGKQFTEIFVKRKENVAHLLAVLEDFEFKVRWPALKLLMALLRNKLKDIQEIILGHPMGVSRLIDLLSDTREIIRNDAIILFVHLTRANSNIQKIVAFENAFDKLFEIIAGEGYADGGVVCEDCLIVFANLLKSNTSNINFFLEGSYVQRLLPFFDQTIEAAGTGNEKKWSTQRASNILFVLAVIRSLVSPRNPTQVTAAAQKVMQKCLLLEKLCSLLLTNDVPPNILTETINTVGEIIRGNHHNQEYFSSVSVPSSPPRAVIVILLMSMVNEKQPFDLRCAVLYCFQCFLYKNEFGQAQIIQTLLPNSTDTTGLTGQLLCSGLFSADSFSNWLSAVALSHTLIENRIQKEQLLRVQFSTEGDSAAISLLQQCCSLLQQCSKIQTRVGLLMFLATWLAQSTLAVAAFLSIPTNVPYLTSQAGLIESDDQETVVQGICAFILGLCVHFNDGNVQSFNKSDLCQLIVDRIGVDTFLDKLNAVSKHEKYSVAARKPQLKLSRTEEISFDYEFCRLFKSLEGTIVKVIQNSNEISNGTETSMTAEQHKLLIQYKNLIREQDEQLNELRRDLGKVKNEFDKASGELNELAETCQQLRDQNALLKAKQPLSSVLPDSVESAPVGLTNLSEHFLNAQVDELRAMNERLSRQLQEADAEIAALKQRQRTSSLSEPLPEVKINIGDFEEEVTSAKQMNELMQLKEDVRKEKAINAKLKTELEIAIKDQDELLDLLADQQAKVNNYRKRLKELGERLDDDGEEDEEDYVDQSTEETTNTTTSAASAT